jgi:Mrp family chromosome partitioning ATPase/predicted Fe-Mo cluster-binding NifX family protein
MTDQCQQPPQAIDDSQRESEELVLQGRMKNIRQKLLVLSGKGGVGKSTVAANLAVSLASAGNRVGLLDIDVHGPSIPKLLGLEGHRIGVVADELVPVRLTNRLAVMSIGFLLPDDNQAVIWRGPRKFHLIRQFLKDVAWGDLDYLVVDSPPGTGDEPMSVAQLVGSPAEAVVVTTPQDLAVADVRRCVSFCKTLSLPVAGIVENMSGFVCPKCGERVELFKAGGGKALADEMNVPFLGAIPIAREIVQSGDAGTPFITTHAQESIGRIFADVVHTIQTRQEPGRAAAATAHQPKENRRMKIAIPVEAGCVSAHFGHCEEFAVYEVDEQNQTILGSTMHKPPAHEPGVLPAWLHELGANVIITGGMGQRAQQLFAQNGIKVVLGSPTGEAEQIAAAYLNGTLQPGDNICDH